MSTHPTEEGPAPADAPDRLAVVAEYPDEGRAKQAGARLLESGIAAELSEEDDGRPDNAFVGGTSVHRLLVFGEDLSRARRVLGLAEPEGVVASSGPETAPATAAKPRWTTEQKRRALVAYLVALIVIPVLAFFATRWLLDPDDVEGPDTTVPVTSPFGG